MVEAGEIPESMMDDRSQGSFWPGGEINNDTTGGNLTPVQRNTYLS